MTTIIRTADPARFTGLALASGIALGPFLIDPSSLAGDNPRRPTLATRDGVRLRAGA